MKDKEKTSKEARSWGDYTYWGTVLGLTVDFYSETTQVIREWVKNT